MSLLFSSRTQGAQRQKITLAQKLIGFFTSHLREAMASLGELWRNKTASVMTIAVLGLSITLPSTLYIMLKNTEQISAGWGQASEITLFLKSDISIQNIQQLTTRLNLWPEVDKLEHISNTQAMQEFKQNSGLGDALNYLPDNPLPHVILVKPTSKHASPTAAKALLEKLNRQREVELGQLDIKWLERLHGLVDIASELVSVIALLLFLAVVLIIGNTIRLNILSKRDEILVLKLVGATDSFIQRPFLYTGFWFGCLGGLMAWLTVSFLLWWISGSIDKVAHLYQTQFNITGLDIQALMVMLCLSIGLGLMGSFVSVHKHIRAIEPT